MPAFFVRCFCDGFLDLVPALGKIRPSSEFSDGGSKASGGLGFVQISAYCPGVMFSASSALILHLVAHRLSSLFTLGHRHIRPREVL